MSYENFGGLTITYENGAEKMAENSETVASRERFYGRVSLAETLVLCSDDRTKELVIRLFGGALNPIYNTVIMKEVNQPDSVTGTFETETESLLPVFQQVGGMKKPGVHSDTQAEGGEDLNLDELEGAVGCGYAELRQAISKGISDDRESHIADAQALRPDLFTSDEDVAFAHDVADAHGRLVESTSFFTSGRRVILTAVKKGAEAIVVGGPHIAKEGILNLVDDTSFDGGKAAAEGLPTYNHDGWATKQVYDNVRSLYPYDSKQQQIAETLDAIGTMRALGVENIDVRWPQAAQAPAA